jgi:hypothetical protein
MSELISRSREESFMSKLDEFPSDRDIEAAIYHDRAIERERHIKHGIRSHLVQSAPQVIVMGSCPCGASYTMTDGKFSAGSKGLFEIMEGRPAHE